MLKDCGYKFLIHHQTHGGIWIPLFVTESGGASSSCFGIGISQRRGMTAGYLQIESGFSPWGDGGRPPKDDTGRYRVEVACLNKARNLHKELFELSIYPQSYFSRWWTSPGGLFFNEKSPLKINWAGWWGGSSNVGTPPSIVPPLVTRICSLASLFIGSIGLAWCEIYNRLCEGCSCYFSSFTLVMKHYNPEFLWKALWSTLQCCDQFFQMDLMIPKSPLVFDVNFALAWARGNPRHRDWTPFGLNLHYVHLSFLFV